jgi:hypothetical protein
MRLQVRKPYQGTTKERICIIVVLANTIFPSTKRTSRQCQGTAKERQGTFGPEIVPTLRENGVPWHSAVEG